MDTVRYFKDLSKTRLKALRAAGEAMALQRVQHDVAVEAGYRSWDDLLHADDIDRQLAVVMTMEPSLNFNGFGPGSFAKSIEERKRNFADWRAELRRRAQHVDEVRLWLLANVVPRATRNPDAYSYRLKHLAEEGLGGYVANGEVIAAAIIAGYAYKPDGNDSPNATFAMSSKSINSLLALRNS